MAGKLQLRSFGDSVLIDKVVGEERTRRLVCLLGELGLVELYDS